MHQGITDCRIHNLDSLCGFDYILLGALGSMEKVCTLNLQAKIQPLTAGQKQETHDKQLKSLNLY